MWLACLGTLALASQGAPAPLPDAQVLLRRAFARYDTARTVQGTASIIHQVTRKCPDDDYILLRFQAQNSVNGRMEVFHATSWRKHSEATGVPLSWYTDAERQAQSSPPNVTTDERSGKRTVLNHPTKQVAVEKRGHQRLSAKLLTSYYNRALGGYPRAGQATLREADYKGRQAYFIEVKSEARSDKRGWYRKGEKGQVEVIIDRQTEAVLRIEGRSTGSYVRVELSDQRFNQPLSQEAVAWSLPKGYELTPWYFLGQREP